MRVFVISAYPTVRAGLRALVQAQPGWSVAGEGTPAGLSAGPAGGAPAAPAGVDVVLADLEAAATGDLLAALLAATQPRAGLVAIGAPVEGPGAAEALRAATGADWLGTLGLGLLPRDATAEEIIATVRAAADGLVVMDRRLAHGLAAAAGGAPAAADRPEAREALDAGREPLTPREREVLQLLAEGLGNKTIASRLHVSEHTAKFHVASIMTKLGASSRTEAVTLAARRGLLIL